MAPYLLSIGRHFVHIFPMLYIQAPILGICILKNITKMTL